MLVARPACVKGSVLGISGDPAVFWFTITKELPVGGPVSIGGLSCCRGDERRHS